jgi:hypothetical protein
VVDVTSSRRRLAVLLAALLVGAAWSGAALAAGAPANTVPPAISGRPQVGAILTTSQGTWTDPSASFAYQWQRCDSRGSGCVDIAGATGQTRITTGADAGVTLVVAATATNGTGSATVTSAPSDVVAAFSVSTSHFVVHYASGAAAGGAITQTQAGDVAARAERAYAAELADGYPAPLSDGVQGGDSRIDIYVQAIPEAGVLAYAQPEGSTAQTYGYIVLNGAFPDQKGLDQHTVAHELFHLIQFGIWLPSSVSDYWLLEGSAEWMGYRADGFPSGDLDLGNWDMSLDCRDANLTFQCDPDDAYKNNGYSRWPFFEYVTERWGADFVRNIFAQGGAGAPTATAAVADAAAAKGSTLTDLFNDWTVANLTGAYAVEGLQSILPPTYGHAISTGTLASLNARTKPAAPPVTSGPIAPVKVAVNHLSARFVAIRHGDTNLPDGPCYKATLSLSVALPGGVGARPYFWWSQKNRDGTKQPAQPLAISGTTASISLPWDTCDWGTAQGYLSLPNPSTTLDAQDFTISGTLSVDRSAEATATPPPDPVVTTAPTSDVSASGGAPRIEVFGPQLIRLSAASRVLRLIVSSSNSGGLKASLGSLALGSARLRAGSNDVRFALPATALHSLRSTSAVANALTLTPVSASGAAGRSVVRRIAVRRTAAKTRTKHSAKASRKV